MSIHVSIAHQRLTLLDSDQPLRDFPISTSKHGVGEIRGSFKTPRGKHVIRAKLGADQPIGAVFLGRRTTGEIYSDQLARQYPERDWILTRIMWLSGTEVGRNRLGEVDTMRRFIYIHGTPESDRLGVPGSIGCVRMANGDIVDLFDLVSVGTIVDIQP